MAVGAARGARTRPGNIYAISEDAIGEGLDRRAALAALVVVVLALVALAALVVVLALAALVGAGSLSRGGRRGSCPDDEASAGDMPRMARQGRAPLDGVGRRRCPITSRYVFAGLRFFITIGGPASGPLPAKHNRAL